MEKKVYVVPRTAQVTVQTESIMMAWSQMVTGGTCDLPPVMGTDGEGEYEYAECWNDFN